MEPPASGKLVYLDIDINENRQAFARAANFVEANDIKYNFSSKNIAELGGRELLSVLDMYAIDYDWSVKGRIVIAPQKCCRIIIRLFEDICPLTCQNFEALVTGSCGKAKGSGIPLHYKNVIFHRIVPGFIAQGGDYAMQNGSGGESIWGKKFKDEKNGLKLKHYKAGIVSMCNSGKNSNGSQFFFTFRACPQLDGKHVVFGEIVHGLEVLDLIQGVECIDGEPQHRVCITECGVWQNPSDINSMAMQGYWSPADVFIATTAATAADDIGSQNSSRIHAFIFASKSIVSERFRSVLVEAAISVSNVSNITNMEREMESIRAGTTFRSGANRFVLIVAPGKSHQPKRDSKVHRPSNTVRKRLTQGGTLEFKAEIFAYTRESTNRRTETVQHEF